MGCVCIQVGIILKGTVIESTVVGGPAFTSMCLTRGDVILEVDGRPVTEKTIEILLTGNDKPGSLVLLTVSKGNDKVVNLISHFEKEKLTQKLLQDAALLQVPLIRVASANIRERQRLFTTLEKIQVNECLSL